MIKRFLKYLLRRLGLYSPPNTVSPWSGHFQSWEEAAALCTGYDHASILEKVEAAVLKVKHGEAVYERDSILFDHLEYTPPILASLENISKEHNNKLNVVDFGGSLGSSFFQYRQLLPHTSLKWTVVEQPHFVETGKKSIAGEGLDFAHTMAEAIRQHPAEVLFMSSVLQYLEKPYQFLAGVMQIRFEYILVDRTAFIEGNEERITVQTVPDYIYKASYPAWFFNEKKFLTAFADVYQCIETFESRIDPKEKLDGVWTYRKGFIFKLKR